jgi:predicted lysophospholipase L1 biosynthesis ABC-type transport system permease subunit
VEEVKAIPGVTDFASMSTTAFDTTFGELNMVMVRQELGRVTPLITKGRAPGPGEVALGALTMQEHGLHLGDKLTLTDVAFGAPIDLTITGVVVLNVAGVDVSIAPGRGGLVDWSLLGRAGDPAQAQEIAPKIFLIDVEPTSRLAVEERLRSIFPTSTSAASVEPLDLTNLADASLLPSALGVVVAFLGIGTAAHAMVSAVRRRRRELAVLKTIGFVSSQARQVVLWQAVTFGVVALGLGVPVGILGGRVSWSIATHALGIPNHPTLAAGWLVVVPVTFLALIALTALVPAQLASRVPAATVLRRD